MGVKDGLNKGGQSGEKDVKVHCLQWISEFEFRAGEVHFQSYEQQTVKKMNQRSDGHKDFQCQQGTLAITQCLV